MQVALMFSLEALAAIGAFYLAVTTQNQKLKRELFIASGITGAVFAGHVALAGFFVA